jgi:sterol desaturase/sphingolipid hydroxylase (fatty acid hydroxylase superfamily)
MSLIEAAIPLVLLLLVLELGWATLRRIRVYRLADSLADLGCAAMDRVMELAVTAVSIGGYAYTARVFSHLVPQLTWPLTPFQAGVRPAPFLAWVVVFLLVDLGQYLVHRLSHRVNLLWACHSVHHSSEELNYTVGLRLSSFHGFFTWVFFLPLAAAGIPWTAVAVCYGLNVLYQFWLHTRLIGRLGWLELVLNTPSHHRVHHGRDPKYLDRNFAGVLIVWDRLFGTFQREEEEPHYGTLAPVASWNPVWANLHGFALIARGWREAPDWHGRLRAVFGPPEALEDAGTRPGRQSHPSFSIAVYSAAHLVLALTATVLIVLPDTGHWAPRGTVAALVLLTLGVLGGLLDGRRWAGPAEMMRLVVAGVVAAALPLNPMAQWTVVALMLVSFCWLTLRALRPHRWALPGKASSTATH